jgi:hypothetical protein
MGAHACRFLPRSLAESKPPRLYGGGSAKSERLTVRLASVVVHARRHADAHSTKKGGYYHDIVLWMGSASKHSIRVDLRIDEHSSGPPYSSMVPLELYCLNAEMRPSSTGTM